MTHIYCLRPFINLRLVCLCSFTLRGGRCGISGREEDSHDCGFGIVVGSIDRHRNGRIVVFESWEVMVPNVPRAKVSVLVPSGEIHVYSFDIFREYGSTRTNSNVNKLER